MSNWVDIGAVSDFPLGSAKNASGVTVFRFDERFYVTETRCPHMGYPMSKGTIRDGIVTCAWHKWDFDLEHGGCYRGSCDDLRIFPYKIEADHLWVDKSQATSNDERWKRLLSEAMMQGDRFLLAKTLAQSLGQGVSTAEIRSVAQKQAFEHGIRAHQNMQAVRELHGIAISAQMSDGLEQKRAVQALLHGLGMASGASGMRPAVVALPRSINEDQLFERLVFYTRESSALGIERLLLSSDMQSQDLHHCLLRCATIPELIYLSEYFLGICICLEELGNNPDAAQDMAALISWVLGAARPQASADAQEAIQWLGQEHKVSNNTPLSEAALRSALDGNNVCTLLDQLATWITNDVPAINIVNAASNICARRLAKLGLNNGGLWRDAIRGLRLCAAMRRMITAYPQADHAHWIYQLGYFLFESRWLQERDQTVTYPSSAEATDWQVFGEAYEQLQLKQTRDLALAAYAHDQEQAVQEIQQHLIKDDLNYEFLAGMDAVFYEMQFQDAFEPYLAGLITYAIDQRNSRNTLAAADFGNSFK